MKLYSATITAGIILSLLNISCKKAIDEQSVTPSQQNSPSEKVTAEPVTPLDRPIFLPSGGRHIEISSTGDAGTQAPIIMVHGLGGFGAGEMGSYNYWVGSTISPSTLQIMDTPHTRLVSGLSAVTGTGRWICIIISKEDTWIMGNSIATNSGMTRSKAVIIPASIRNGMPTIRFICSDIAWEGSP